MLKVKATFIPTSYRPPWTRADINSILVVWFWLEKRLFFFFFFTVVPCEHWKKKQKNTLVLVFWGSETSCRSRQTREQEYVHGVTGFWGIFPSMWWSILTRPELNFADSPKRCYHLVNCFIKRCQNVIYMCEWYRTSQIDWIHCSALDVSLWDRLSPPPLLIACVHIYECITLHC